MSNKAFGIFRALKKAGQVDPLDELRRRRVADCVIREISHDEQRPYSEVELLGRAWRKRNGFGRPYMKLGGRGQGCGYRQRRNAAELANKRKAQKASRVRNKIANDIRSAGVMFGKALMLAKSASRKAGRGQ